MNPSPLASPARGLATLVRALRLALAGAWALFSAWLLVYGMPLSAFHALLGLWALWPSRPGGRWLLRSLATILIFGAGILTLPLVGLPEYAATTNRLHCRALGFTGARAPSDCDPAELERGARIAEEGGPLYSTRERLGVHGFNLLLAAGGLLAGFPEVAWETARMSFLPSPLPSDATTEVRRASCRASYGDARASTALLAAPVEEASDFPMRSSRVRRAIARGVHQLGDAPGSIAPLDELHFTEGGRNNDAYALALATDSLRVALALEVGDSRLALERLEGGRIRVRWTGTIHYPGTDIAFAWPLPTLLGPVTLRVSEAVLCGMHVDGAMNPYPLSYVWELDPEDPRLGPERFRSERGALEEGVMAIVVPPYGP